MKLYGQELSRAEVVTRLGGLDQVASTTAVTAEEGPARGSRRIQAKCGDISFEVFPDRALDIGDISFRGVPMAWTSPTGLTSPWNYDPSPMGWLRSFPGGLLSTCGLDSFGSPSQDGDESFPLHGRASTLQADHVAHDSAWTDKDDCEVLITGRIRQARLFGENLELRREIRCRLNDARLVVHDIVTNLGPDDQPHMLLYHVNLGWPLVDQGATLEIPSLDVIPRDADARAGIGEWAAFAPPTHPFAEQVFRHRLPEPPTDVDVALRNSRLGISLSMKFSTGTLPHLFQWKMLGSGTYVLGLEPANCPVIEGRRSARESGVMPALAPGESRHYELSFEFMRLGTAAARQL